MAQRYEPRPATAVWPPPAAPATPTASGYPPATPSGYPTPGASGYPTPGGFGPPPGGFGPPPGGFGAGPPAEGQMRPPSGLFPGLPPRPVYREPHPVRSGPLFAGLGSAVLWFVLFGSLGHNLASYAWWTIVAGITAWAVSVALAILGDRGVATGVALASGFGLSIALGLVAERWITTYQWPLW